MERKKSRQIIWWDKFPLDFMFPTGRDDSNNSNKPKCDKREGFALNNKVIHKVLLLFYGSNVHFKCLQVGDESYESYCAERDGILSSLARRAKVNSFYLSFGGTPF